MSVDSPIDLFLVTIDREPFVKMIWKTNLRPDKRTVQVLREGLVRRVYQQGRNKFEKFVGP